MLVLAQCLSLLSLIFYCSILNTFSWTPERVVTVDVTVQRGEEITELSMSSKVKRTTLDRERIEAEGKKTVLLCVVCIYSGISCFMAPIIKLFSQHCPAQPQIQILM